MIDLADLTVRSPLRVLDRSIHGGLGAGNLGVVCGAAGVGKSAFLVSVSLDELMRERQVLHVALDHPPERVRAYYDEILRELVRGEDAGSASDLWLRLERGLRIQAYVGGTFRLDGLARTIALLEEQTGLAPDVLVVDGYDWLRGKTGEIDGLKRIAGSLGAPLWMSAALESEDLASRYASHVDVFLHLKAEGNAVRLQLLKDHEGSVPRPLALGLDPTTLLLVRS